ncbi:MAG: hypothetical protein RMJ18_02125 [Candidatus Aenigmarchaeota archaeon]|nr:hypothetical protein [Candidatus Aenigmarchaeota archaeon]MDW8160192.1 hypothetical protein [Candidatus Aenigmarchaeota archaeon]
MGKFDKREYIKELYITQKTFSDVFGIYICKKFDPRRWLNSIKVEAKLIWPKDIEEAWQAIKNGECISLDFWFKTYTKKECEKKYDFTIKYSLKNGLLYPAFYSHNCPFLSSNLISIGPTEIACKHLYAVLREVERVCEKDPEIPIHYSFFLPRNERIFVEFEKIEKNRKMSTIEKMKKTFGLLANYIYLNESIRMGRLNKTLENLKRV